MSDFLENLIGKARSALAEVELERNSVSRDFFDKRSWLYVTDQMPALREMIEGMEEARPTSPALQEDLFNIFNQGDPRQIETELLAPEYRPQSMIAKGLLEAPDLKLVRKHTRYDDFASARALMVMQDRLEENFEALEEVQQAIADALQELTEALQAAQQAMEEGEGGQEAGEALQQALAAFEQADEAASESEQEVMIQDLMDDAASTALEEIERDLQQASSYGIEPGQLQQMDFEERARLVKQLSESKLRSFADQIGQWQTFADAERRRSIRNAPSEVVDVELGNRLERLTSSEVTHLAVPELEDLFWLRWAQHRLQQKVTRGAERAGRGPIIIVCDESGSMGARLGGSTREAWSKAVSLAFCDQARRQKRDFYYIGFSSAGQVWEKQFPKGESQPDDVIEFVRHNFSGGTSYERPLTRAMEIVRTYRQKDQRLPDILFITDDECNVTDQFVQTWNEERYAADVKCFGLQVGGSVRAGNPMSKLCDRSITIDNLASNPQDLKDLFRTI